MISHLYSEIANRREIGNYIGKICNDKKSSGKRDSNPRPSAWEADALPTELLLQRN